MRIIGGARRGLKLAEVGEGDPAAHLRPTSDRVRESLFSSLESDLHAEAGAWGDLVVLVAGMRRLVDPATASPYAQVLEPVLNASAIVAGPRITIARFFGDAGSPADSRR